MQTGVSVYSTNRILIAIALIFVSLFTARVSAAQSAGTGTISGTITDPSGAAIAAATVDVRNSDTGIVRTVTTDEAGLYYAPFLQPRPLRGQLHERRIRARGAGGLYCCKLAASWRLIFPYR